MSDWQRSGSYIRQNDQERPLCTVASELMLNDAKTALHVKNLPGREKNKSLSWNTLTFFSWIGLGKVATNSKGDLWGD